MNDQKNLNFPRQNQPQQLADQRPASERSNDGRHPGGPASGTGTMGHDLFQHDAGQYAGVGSDAYQTHNGGAHYQESDAVDLEAGSQAKGGKASALNGLNSLYHFVSIVGHYALVFFERGAGLIFKPRRGAGRLVNIFSSFFLVAIIGGGVFYYIMGWRALSVGFLKPQIEAALAENFGDADVRLDDVLLQRDTERGGLFLRLTNMVIRGENKETIAASPETAIGLNFFSLLTGNVEPDSLSLIGPEIHMVRNERGDWTLWRDERDRLGELIINPSLEETSGSQMPDLAKLGDLVKGGLNKAHHQLQLSNNLSHIGVLKARVILHQGRGASENAGAQGLGDIWYIPSFSLQYSTEGEKRLIGRGVIQRENAPGSAMWVAVTHQEGDAFVDMKTQLQNVVPAELSSLVPVLQSLRPVHVGVSGDLEARVHFTEGLVAGHLSVSLSDGHIGLLGEEGPVFQITRGAFEFEMEAGAKHIVMKQGDLFFPSGQISLKGDIWRDRSDVELPDWRFQLYSTGGEIFSNSDTPLNIQKIDEFNFSGQLFGARVPLLIDELRAQVGTSSIIIAHDASLGYPAILRGRITNLPMSLLKSIWPENFHQESRDWVFENVKSGVVQTGSFALETFGESEVSAVNVASHKRPVLPSLSLNIKDFSYTVFDEAPLLIRTERAKIEISGKTMVATMAKGYTDVPDGGKLSIRDGKVVVADYEPRGPDGVISFKVNSTAPAVIALLKRKPLNHNSGFSDNAKNLKGDITGQLTIHTPLRPKVRDEDVKIEGKLILNKGRATFGKIDVRDGKIDFLLGPNFIEAKGDMLVNGVSASLAWRRQFNTTAGYEVPPLVVRGVYDEADRNQFGLDINHVVQGAVPLEVVFKEGAGGQFNVKFSADLTKAVLLSPSLGWRKDAGSQASLDFDLVQLKNGGSALENFKIEGRDISARGRVVLDKNSKVRVFDFPKVSYKVVSNIVVKGNIDKRKIWHVQAAGKTFDGRGILKSLLRTGQIGNGKNKGKANAGIDLIAQFNTVIGWQQSKLDGFKIKMKRRGDKLNAFAVTGTLRNGGSLKADLVKGSGRDQEIRVVTSDAGEALRMVGFYPSMLGGTGRLTVRYNVKKRQLASKTGRLVIERFSIASDPVVREVLANVGSGKKLKSAASQDIIPFTRLVAPFSIGHGQFVLHDSYVSGELLGATMRGKIDFQNEEVRLAGTYIPLYGLNAAVGAVPVLGEILVGRRGEGMLGITFGIYGKLSSPEVLVNPMSLVAPGVFRQIFEFDQGNQKIRVRPDKSKDKSSKLDQSASKAVRRKSGSFKKNGGNSRTSSSIQRKN